MALRPEQVCLWVSHLYPCVIDSGGGGELTTRPPTSAGPHAVCSADWGRMAPCSRSCACSIGTSTLRTEVLCFNASAAAVPAASPIAMHVPITRAEAKTRESTELVAPESSSPSSP